MLFVYLVVHLCHKIRTVAPRLIAGRTYVALFKRQAGRKKPRACSY